MEGGDAKKDSAHVEEFRTWPSSKFADPKNVEHGIRLSKPIAQTAKSWWAQRWLSIIHQFGLGVRLERAKLYATRGQVLSIQIENGVVKSLVQGADNDPYRVIIAVKTIPGAIWTSILSDFARSSSFGITVASGALPSEEEIDRTFRENGVLLFPDRQGEMQTKCSCLDWSNPCKHIAAVYLLLAAEFERDPLLIFKLRGLAATDLFSLLKTPTDEQGQPTPALGESVSPFALSKSDVARSSSEHASGHRNIAGTGDITGDARQKGGSTSGIASSKKRVDSARARAGREADQTESTHAGVAHTAVARLDPRMFWKKAIKASDLQETWAPASEVGALPQSLGEFPFWQGNTELLAAVRFVYELAPLHAARVLSAVGKDGDNKN